MSFSPAAVLRKAGPYALFLLLGVAMLYGPALLHTVLDYVHSVHPAPTLTKATYALAALGDPHATAVVAAAGNATSAEVVADQQASGWPTPGLVTGKLITAAGAFVFFTILRWLVQQLTHPGPTRWAKTEYSDAFDGLEGRDKFTVYAGIRLNSVLLAFASLLFAALVV